MSKNKTLTELALEKAAEQSAAAQAQARQLGLWEAPKTVEQEEAAQEAARSPKGGRPAGSRNKGSSKLAAYLRSMGYRDPAARLAAMAGLNSDLDPVRWAVEQAKLINAALGAGTPKADMVLSLIKEQRQALEGVMPYLHGKLTPDVNVNTNVAASISIGGAALQAGADGPRAALPPGEMSFAFTPANLKQNQGVIEGAPLKSNGEGLTERSSD